MTKVRVAAARYAIEGAPSFDAFAHRLREEIRRVAHHDARFIVLPEYLPLALRASLAPSVQHDLARTLAALQVYRDEYLELARDLADESGAWIVAGTFLERVPSGLFRNRAWIASPEGGLAYQDKLTLTRIERRTGLLEPGDALRVFESPLGRFAVNVCYDVEFPLYARAQAEAGAQLLLVPSSTETQAGASRVRVGARARALEQHLFVACSVTAGSFSLGLGAGTHAGAAGIYGPIDHGLSDDGVFAETIDGWALAELELGERAIDDRRAHVANYEDWDAQLRPSVREASVLRVGD